MTPSEKNLTAWIDGGLSGEEAARFERRLGGALPEARREREEALKLGGLLRTHGRKAAALENGDFFNHQLLERIAAQTPRQAPSRPARPWVPLWRLFWSAAVCCGIAVLASVSILQPVGRPEPGYFAEVLNPKPGSRWISASSFYSKKDKVTVIWLDGLDRVNLEGRP